MKYITRKVVEAYEIEKAVKLQFGVDIELRSLMWSEAYINDSYKKLYFGDSTIKHNQANMRAEETNDVYRERALVYAIMKDCFPNDEYVFVDVSW